MRDGHEPPRHQKKAEEQKMWTEKTIVCPVTGVKYNVWVKHFQKGSEYGIDEGKISKLTIRKDGDNRDLCHYDRGWGKMPTDEVKAIYDLIIAKYN
jgi:hypothetical protein